jgi:hypothetical protein
LATLREVASEMLHTRGAMHRSGNRQNAMRSRRARWAANTAGGTTSQRGEPIMQGKGLWRSGVAASVLLACTAGSAAAISLDKEGTITFGLRTYTNTRIGTESTDQTNDYRDGGAPPGPPSYVNSTFPFSAAGHVRQIRWFIEAELEQNLQALQKEGVGPLALLNQLPFKVKNLGYHLTYRGQGDLVYDWGPREYSTADSFQGLAPNPISLLPVDIGAARSNLRQVSGVNNQLYQAYLQADVGDLFIRFGRQILVWGETDVFRLLDNINPLNNSYGGFLVSLDERRVPLDMLRLQYTLGDFWKITESFVEGYWAIDDKVGWEPFIPYGSAWTFPNLGTPNAPDNTTQIIARPPTRTVDHSRGGARLVWNMFDATFSVAQYFTYVDVPGLQIKVEPNFPLQTFPDGISVKAVETAPRVSVTGGSTTFALPALYSVVRSEIAYLHGEPRYTQAQLDPFSLRAGRPPRPNQSELQTGNSLNMALGLDINRYVRFLNPNQTMLISTQFFVKHLFDPAAQTPIRHLPQSGPIDPVDGEVLPVPGAYISPNNGFPAVRPIFVREPTDTFLNTLLVTTSYRSSTIEPQFVLLYDWGGAFLYQPGVTFRYDPFRFVVDASFISAHTLKGGSGVSLYKDRSNVQFRIEYVI